MARTPVSLVGLVVVVFVCGVGFAALKYADERWARGIIALTLILLTMGIAFALLGRGRARAVWAAFSLLVGIYLLVSLGPLRDRCPDLPTSRWLEQVRPRIHKNTNHQTLISRSQFDMSYSAWAEAHPDAEEARLSFDPEDPTNARLVWITTEKAPFQRIGHGLIALAIGYVGSSLLALLMGLRTLD